MKKIIQILITVLLLTILTLIIIAVFNPFNLRTKFIGSIINSYLSNNIENYSPINDTLNDSSNSISSNTQVEEQSNDKHPLLNEEQEKKLESFGINVKQLPTSVTPGMKECFVEKLGETRADEIIKGDMPSAIEFFKTKECIGK